MSRVGDVTVKCAPRLDRRVECEFVSRAEIEILRGDSLARRPCVVRRPLVRPGLERQRLRLLQFAFVLQPIVEPRVADFFVVVAAGVFAEINRPQGMAVRARPLPVIPRAGDEIVQMPVVALLHQLEDFLWAVKIFLIPPARNVHDRDSNACEIRSDGLALPEGIVVWMTDVIFPGWKIASGKFTHIRERPQV